MTNLEQEIMLGVVSDETLLEAEQTLTTEEFQRYTFMAQTQKKSDLVAWLLWIFVGTFQIHMLYLNLFNDRHQKVLRIIGLILLYFVIGWVIIFPLWIYDAIKMSSYIKESNNMEKAKILNMFLAKNKGNEPVNAKVVQKETVQQTETVVETQEPIDAEIVEKESIQQAETFVEEKNTIDETKVVQETINAEIIEKESTKEAENIAKEAKLEEQTTDSINENEVQPKWKQDN